MRTTPSEAYDPIDIASLCLWRQEQSGDNQERIPILLLPQENDASVQSLRLLPILLR